MPTVPENQIVKLAVIPGDGIGPEVIAEAEKVLDAATEGRGIRFDKTRFSLGAARYLETGDTLTDADLEAIKAQDAILLGAVGGVPGDPRLKALVVQNSGLFGEGAPRIPGMDVPKSALRALHTPVIYVQGGPTDIAYANGRDDFARIDHVPAVMVDLLGKGHGGTYFEPNGGKAARIVVDWLEWQLRGDAEAAKSFLGEDCRLCGEPEVAIETRNLR